MLTKILEGKCLLSQTIKKIFINLFRDSIASTSASSKKTPYR
ncbi:hypothetical protein ACHAXS_009340, partial [Conticribra weissflogii]